MNATSDPPAAPGVTKEVEDAITAYGECKHDDYFKWIAMKRDAKIALLAAIEKYGKQQREAGAEEERGDYPEQEHTPYD